MTGNGANWDELYNAEAEMFEKTPPPWNLGEPQQVIIDLERAGRITGKVLDAACGIGSTSLYLAARGYETVGLDISESAIAQAALEAASRGLDCVFEVADMSDFDGYAGRFDTIVDNASYHSIPGELRPGYMACAARAAAPGAKLYILCSAVTEIPVELKSMNMTVVTEESLWEVVSRHWVIDEISPSHMEAILPPGFPEKFVPPSARLTERGRMRGPAWFVAAHLPA